MGWPDSCLYWQAISSLIAVQYHCQPLIEAPTAFLYLADMCVIEHLFACVHLSLEGKKKRKRLFMHF